MKYIYVSGGACRLSVQDPVLGRLTKKNIAVLVARLFPGRFRVQAHPNLQTDMVIVPDGVCSVSDTTRSKVRPNVEVISWSAWKRKYFVSRRSGSSRAGGGSMAGPAVMTKKKSTKSESQKEMLQKSLEEEKVAAKGTRRTWRLRRARELLAKNSQVKSLTRGWAVDFPLKGKERQELYRKCGQKCFLGPNLSFPVCKRCTDGSCNSCRYDKRGVQAAFQRARQWGHSDVAAKADRLRKQLA